MKMKSTLLLLLSCILLKAQPGTINMTPVQSLGLMPVNVEVPDAFKSTMPQNYVVNLPQGYKARIFYAGGLNKPRFMSMGPGGMLYVSDYHASGGRVLALPDKDHDGIADTVIAVAAGFSNNHDVKFYKDAMYVTERTRIWKMTNPDQNGVYQNKVLFIENIGGNTPAGNHQTRTLVFDSVNAKAYVSIGSVCNACRETERAIIRQYNDDGTGGRVYATGIRNAVGMTMHPKTNRLWANNNGTDYLGNELPPEWIDLIRPDGFYGYPVAYANQVWVDFDAHPDYQALKPATAMDTANVDRMIEPAALIRAHQAPMALMFLDDNFPKEMRKGFLSALRGSWNTTEPKAYRGYKIIYGDLSSDQDTTVNYVADFCSGFLTDSVNQVFWGRPVGLASDAHGNVFVSSDEGNKFVMMIYRDAPSGLKESADPFRVKLYPNPVKDELNIELELNVSSTVSISLVDVTGKQMMSYASNGKTLGSGLQQLRMNTSALQSGIYFCVIQVNGDTKIEKVFCVK